MNKWLQTWPWVTSSLPGEAQELHMKLCNNSNIWTDLSHTDRHQLLLAKSLHLLSKRKRSLMETLVFWNWQTCLLLLIEASNNSNLPKIWRALQLKLLLTIWQPSLRRLRTTMKLQEVALLFQEGLEWINSNNMDKSLRSHYKGERGQTHWGTTGEWRESGNQSKSITL